MNEFNDHDTPMTPEVELELLKERARKLGIKFSENIGVATLRERVANKLNNVDDAPDPEPNPAPTGDTPLPQPGAAQAPAAQTPAAPQPAVQAAPAPQAVQSRMSLRQRLIEENMKLVRLRIVNLDPKKKDLHGEIFTVANEYIGTVRKFVPYGEATENGYHVPHCIYKMLKARKFLSIRTKRDPHHPGELVIEQNWVPEFALEVMPQLTPAELKDLATAQAAAGGL